MPWTPQQNGVAERRNRTLLEMVRSIMAQANLPISYWGDAILTAAYILNLVPSKLVPSTPYELWIGKKPDLSNLRPWGSAGFVHDTSHKYGKLGLRGKKCIFIRYSEHSKGYVLIGEQPDGSITEVKSRDVDFIENKFPSRGEIDKDLTLYEMMDPNEGAPSSLVENQEEILETPRDSGSDLQPSESAPLEEDHNNLSLIEVNVEVFLVVALRLKGKLSWFLHKMMKRLEQYKKLSHLLLVING
jgi:hypothetical protein